MNEEELTEKINKKGSWNWKSAKATQIRYNKRKEFQIMLKSYQQGKEELKKEIIEIIDKCKIHTCGALILIEEKELKEKIGEIK